MQKLADLRLINPAGSKKVVWDLVCGLAIFYSIVEVPFRIGFQSTQSEVAVVMDSIVEAIFFCDIILTFNTAFVDQVTDVFVADRWLIAKEYGKLWLWIDLASTIPFDQIVIAAASHDSPNISTFRLIRVLRLVRLTKLIKLVGSKNIKEYLDQYSISPAFISIFTLLLQIFLVAHIVCCFWFFITTTDATGFQANAATDCCHTWVTEANLLNADVETQYIASLYWAFATMLTVGYGDIHATNTGERFYAFLTMLLGSLMFGAIIAKVSVLVESRNLQLKELKIGVAEFKAYLEERRIPNALKTEAKVRAYVRVFVSYYFPFFFQIALQYYKCPIL